MHNTSRVEDEKYPNLLREKGFSGFPSLCFMDAEGNVLVKQGERSVKGFRATLARLEHLAELKAKLQKGGGAELERDVFLAELELQSLRADEIKQRMEKMHLDKADLARVDAFLVDAEIRDLRARSRELGQAAVTEAIAAMAKAGREPTADGASMFWQTTLVWCSKNGEGELAQKAFDALEPLRLPAAVKKRNQAMLEQAKAGKKDGGE